MLAGPRPDGRLVPDTSLRESDEVTEEPLVTREEVVTTMWLIADIALAARRFLELTEDDDGEEEAEGHEG